MPQYFRNQDDAHSDPYLIGMQYQVGRNAFFEVSLTLAEMADANSSLRGGEAASPDVVQVQYGSAFTNNCPEVNQYIWIDERKAVKARSIVGKDVNLYNPVTRNFNRLVSAEIVRDQPLFKIVTSKGIESIVSQSHKVITDSSDLFGVPLIHYGAGRSILSFDEGRMGKLKNWNTYSDTLVEISDAGFGDVVKIALATEYIYACGTKKTEGTCAHNRKANPDDNPV